MTPNEFTYNCNAERSNAIVAILKRTLPNYYLSLRVNPTLMDVTIKHIKDVSNYLVKNITSSIISVITSMFLKFHADANLACFNCHRKLVI